MPVEFEKYEKCKRSTCIIYNRKFSEKRKQIRLQKEWINIMK